MTRRKASICWPRCLRNLPELSSLFLVLLVSLRKNLLHGLGKKIVFERSAPAGHLFLPRCLYSLVGVRASDFHAMMVSPLLSMPCGTEARSGRLLYPPFCYGRTGTDPGGKEKAGRACPARLPASRSCMFTVRISLSDGVERGEWVGTPPYGTESRPSLDSGEVAIRLSPGKISWGLPFYHNRLDPPGSVGCPRALRW